MLYRKRFEGELAGNYLLLSNYMDTHFPYFYSSFPACLKSSLHRTHCYLPCPAAHVMSHDPQLVAAAVHALCERDPADMKVCRRMECFSPSRHSSVTAEVGDECWQCGWALANQELTSATNKIMCSLL